MVETTDSAYVTPAEFARKHTDDLAVPHGFNALPQSALIDNGDLRVIAAYEMLEGVNDQVGLEYHPYNDEYPFWVTWWHIDHERASTGAATFEEGVAAFEAMLETVRAAVQEYDDRLGSTLADQ